MDLNISEGVKLPAQLVMTGRGCIIGQSGSGKSFLMGIVAEELGGINLPFCVIDTEGEYASLKVAVPSLIVVGGSNADLPITIEMEKLFAKCIADSVPIVLDLSDVIQKTEFVYKALSILYKLEESVRKPFLVMIEEADKFAPQVVHQKINIIEELSVRGRKRGIGLLIATQRPSNISKNVLSQCSYGFIGKLTIENDLNAISQLFSNRSTLDEIVTLEAGEFMPFGSENKEKFKVKPRTAFHMGSTPQIIERGSEKAIDVSTLIKELKGAEPSRQSSKNKKAPIPEIKNITILAIESLFTEEMAKDYAEKISKKMFGIFGRKLEIPEKIQQRYLPLSLCTIQIPTKKQREFDEFSVLLTQEGYLVRINSQVSIKKFEFKYGKLTPSEEFILAMVRSRKNIKREAILTEYSSKSKNAGMLLNRMSSRKLITTKNDKISAENYRSFEYQNTLDSNVQKVSVEEITGHSITKEKAIIALKFLYPTSSLSEFYELYLPYYEIILRNKNKIRLFKIDGIFGKEILYL